LRDEDVRMLAEVEDILRNVPERSQILHETAENLAWIGRACSVIESWDATKTPQVLHATNEIATRTRTSSDGIRKLLTLLEQARANLRFKTVGPLNSALGQGRVFEYFDEVRKIIEMAGTELFFVDPYLNADFVSRYMPFVKSGVMVKLMTTNNVPGLVAAVDMFCKQTGLQMSVRSTVGFHDRWIIVDRTSSYQSGASFKDGAVKAPTTLMQNMDLFPAMLKTYEDMWSAAKVESP
jgi:hypothetical protein